MKNVTLDRATVLQLDADRTDSALDAAADCHVLRSDAALDLRAIADLEIRRAHLAFDSAEDLSRTIAFDLADDRHAGADARARCRFRRRLQPRCGLFNDRVLRLRHPSDGFDRICRRVLILLGCLTLEAIQHVHLLFSPAQTAQAGVSKAMHASSLMAFLRSKSVKDAQSPQGQCFNVRRIRVLDELKLASRRRSSIWCSACGSSHICAKAYEPPRASYGCAQDSKRGPRGAGYHERMPV